METKLSYVSDISIYFNEFMGITFGNTFKYKTQKHLLGSQNDMAPIRLASMDATTKLDSALKLDLEKRVDTA